MTDKQDGAEALIKDYENEWQLISLPKESVEEYDWSELSKIAQEIAYKPEDALDIAKKYRLVNSQGALDGTQTKQVVLADGLKTKVQICGFVHDNRTASGKAGITFIFQDAICELPMNDNDCNAGGWNKSFLRNYLNQDLFAMLPGDLRKVIVPVNKLTNNCGHTRYISSVSVTSDSLWLFSSVEISGKNAQDLPIWHKTIESIWNAEGMQYVLFLNQDQNNLTKKQNGEICRWWTRSPAALGEEFFQTVSAYGFVNDIAMANKLLGVVPGFCI